MSDWHPIETAPRDEHILLYGEQTDDDKCGVRHRGALVLSGYWCDIDEAWCSTGTQWTGPFYRPTHWMPLPAPPEDK